MTEPRIDDLRAYAAQLTRALHEGGAEGGAWRPLVERGLAAAYAQGDIVALCDVIQPIISVLDARGRFREALAEVEYAVSISNGEPNALAMLLSVRATMEAGCGLIPAALQSVAGAERFLPGVSLDFVRGRCRSGCTGARWMALDTTVPMPEELTLNMPGGTRTADSLFLMSIFIPFAFASGRGAEMHPWIRALRIQAESATHEYRLADVAVFQAAQGELQRLSSLPEPRDVFEWNWLAQWRLATLRLRSALLKRNWAGIAAELQGLDRARARAGDADLGPPGAFAALCQAQFDDGERTLPSLYPPATVHLGNLASVLAAAEAVATAGTRAAALKWSDWLRASLSKDVVTCLEWPVSRARIQALLFLRCGDFRSARRSFEQAIDWAADAGHSIELAIAQLQLAEFLGQQPGGFERTCGQLRRQAVPALRDVGVDAVPLAYQVAHMHPRPQQPLRAARLTQRELDVLVALSDGLTYRAAGTRLGIGWTTVQTLAHRCYAKLQASGKAAAIARARDLDIL